MSCWAPGLTQDESSILDSSAIDEGASSELDLEEAYQQLERMKQRVLQMKSKIVRSLPTELATDQVAPDSDNVNLREIQLETSRGFQQIKVVQSRLKENTKDLCVLSARMKESMRCTQKLAKQLDEVPRWMEEHKQQVGKCLERYNELETSCCTDIDYSNHMRPLAVNLNNLYRARVPLKCYKREYSQIKTRLCRTWTLLHHTRKRLMRSTRRLKTALASGQAPQDLTALKRLTEILEADERVKQVDVSEAKPSWLERLSKGNLNTTPRYKQLITARNERAN